MTQVLADPVAEVERILAAAAAANVPIRAVGGLAVALRCPTVASLHPPRTYHDIDLAAPAGRPEVSSLLTSLGYEPSRRFNTLNGAERLLFHDPDGRRIDVFIETLRMCHTLRFAERLEIDERTLPLADLLLSKLQIVELTPRDEQDALALLADHDLTDDDAGIGLPRLRDVCATDWGWWKTVDDNLTRLIERWTAGETADTPSAGVAATRASELRDALRRWPKTPAWRARSLIGTRLRWFDEPEEVR